MLFKTKKYARQSLMLLILNLLNKKPFFARGFSCVGLISLCFCMFQSSDSYFTPHWSCSVAFTKVLFNFNTWLYCISHCNSCLEVFFSLILLYCVSWKLFYFHVYVLLCVSWGHKSSINLDCILTKKYLFVGFIQIGPQRISGDKKQIHINMLNREL